MQTSEKCMNFMDSLAGGVAEAEAYPEDTITKMRNRVIKLRAIVVPH